MSIANNKKAVNGAQGMVKLVKKLGNRGTISRGCHLFEFFADSTRHEGDHVNCGVGGASQNAKALEGTISDIALVTGQKSVVTQSRKAIAGFKLRRGVPFGVTLTLRGDVCF